MLKGINENLLQEIKSFLLDLKDKGKWGKLSYIFLYSKYYEKVKDFLNNNNIKTNEFVYLVLNDKDLSDFICPVCKKIEEILENFELDIAILVEENVLIKIQKEFLKC